MNPIPVRITININELYQYLLTNKVICEIQGYSHKNTYYTKICIPFKPSIDIDNHNLG